MKRTPEDRERFRRLLEENEAARREFQALLDRVEARMHARRQGRGWVPRLLGGRTATR